MADSQKELYRLKELIFTLSCYAGIHTFNGDFDTKIMRRKVRDLFNLDATGWEKPTKQQAKMLAKQWLAIVKERDDARGHNPAT